MVSSSVCRKSPAMLGFFDRLRRCFLKSTFFFVFLAYLSKNCHIFVVLSH